MIVSSRKTAHATAAGEPRSPAKRRRRWFQFSLRTLLVMMIAAGVWLGWKCERASRQREAVAAVQALGGRVVFDFEFDRDGAVKRLGGMGTLWRLVTGREFGEVQSDAEPPGPQWLRQWMGDEFFQEVVVVDLNVGEGRAGDSIGDSLQYLPVLEFLDLSGNDVTDDGLRHLAQLRRLERLYLDHCPITDAGLIHLKDMKNLEYLSLEETHITDAGLDYLKQLPKLRWLNLGKTRITDRGLQELKTWKHVEQIHVHGTKVTTEPVDGTWDVEHPVINYYPPGILG